MSEATIRILSFCAGVGWVFITIDLFDALSEAEQFTRFSGVLATSLVSLAFFARSVFGREWTS